MSIGDEILEIGNELYILETTLTSITWRLGELNAKIAQRKVDLTPEDGWPGKNATERKANEKKMFTEDPTLQSYYDQLEPDRELRHNAEGSIKALEAKRRSCEWYIRFLGLNHVSETEED